MQFLPCRPANSNEQRRQSHLSRSGAPGRGRSDLCGFGGATIPPLARGRLQKEHAILRGTFSGFVAPEQNESAKAAKALFYMHFRVGYMPGGFRTGALSERAHPVKRFQGGKCAPEIFL